LKILLLSHRFYPDIGGIETFSEVLANNFFEAGHQIRILTWSKDANQKIFPFRVIRNPNTFTLIKNHAWADIVLENNPCLRLSWPSIFFKSVSFVVLQTWFTGSESKKSIGQKVKSWWLKRADKVIAISEAIRNKSFSTAVVIGNSYNEKEFRTLQGINREKDFVFVGRLVSDKGVRLAIEALHLLFKQNRSSDFSFTIIGDGPERPVLEEMVTQLQLNPFIRFAGSMRGEALVQELNQHKYMLVPSLWEEPFGIVALEGLACGCLPFVSDGGGLPEAVGDAGILFRRNDAKDLAEQINNAVNSPGNEEKIRDACAIHLASFHPKIISAKYLSLMETVLAEADRPAAITEPLTE
jgi:glycosyltransferase involved in cell wall biosynthesis